MSVRRLAEMSRLFRALGSKGAGDLRAIGRRRWRGIFSTAAVPPTRLVGKALGRAPSSFVPSPWNAIFTDCEPPNAGTVIVTSPPSALASPTLYSRPSSSFAATRAATSRP